MEKEIDLNQLWARPSPEGSDKIAVLIFKEPRDVVIRIGIKEVRHGPFKVAFIDPIHSRFIFFFQSNGQMNKLSVPSKGIDELLFWPTGMPLDR